jgi:C-terminal processing protease CtpA/Prc
MIAQTRLALLALLPAAVSLSCGGGGGGGFEPGAVSCTADYAKNRVLSIARTDYLYLEDLPASVDVAAFTGSTPRGAATSLLDFLTQPARTRGVEKDGWSYLTPRATSNQFFQEGQTLGYGISFTVRASDGVSPCAATAPGGPLPTDCRVFLAQVFSAAPAAAAGFLRGDELLAVGEPGGTLAPVGPLVADGTFGAALGPSVAGTTRVFSVAPVASPGAPVQRTMSRAVYTIDPVNRFGLLDLDGVPGGEQAGYVGLRTFISTADPALRTAFQQFKTAGVTRVIVDVRYNGGGLVSIAELFSNLLASGRAGSLMFTQEFNTRNPGAVRVTFQDEAQAVPAAKIAFIMSEGSASASELVANNLEPYVPVAIVGERSYGKPVGQFGFEIPACNDLLFLIAFRLRNAQGDAGYFQGLPDAGGQFGGPLCPASDDLSAPQGDAAEDATGTALRWLAGSDPAACPAPAHAAARARAAAGARVTARDLLPPEPTVAQREIPGLF